MSEHESKPRVLSLENFSFNFRISLKDRIRARAGAPAFAMRRMRTDRKIAAFWAALERKRKALWIAAGEGRIADDGREIRQALLDDEGRDRHAELEHKWRVLRDKADLGDVQKGAFNRAWRRHVQRCGIEGVQSMVDDYNRYFPIEANLKTDTKTGRFQWMGGLWEPMVPPTRDDVLERYPLL